VFRSRSELNEQYHDYIYRNVGEELKLTATGKPVEMIPSPDRYQANAKSVWLKNRIFRHPGWHFFEDVNSSGQMDESVRATFRAKKLTDEPIEMRAFIPGSEDRTYTTATSPPMWKGPKDYRFARAPTLVIRQQGEAWDRPFAVVYEPVSGERNSVASVEVIWRARRCQGMVVKSNERAGGLTQLILTPSDPEQITEYPDYQLSFRGRYAVLTLAPSGKVQSVYIGKGQLLSFGEYRINPVEGNALSAFLDFSTTVPSVSTKTPLWLEQTGKEKVRYPSN